MKGFARASEEREGGTDSMPIFPFNFFHFEFFSAFEFPINNVFGLWMKMKKFVTPILDLLGLT